MSKTVRIYNGNYKVAVAPGGLIELNTGPQGLSIATGRFEVQGESISATNPTFKLLPTTVATLEFATTATDITIGSNGFGITKIRNALDVNLDLNVDGNFTTNSTTFDILNENALEINFAGEADLINVGKSGGIFNLLSNFQLGGNLTVGGDVSINGGDLTTTATTFNLLNTVATTINFAGDATSLTIGSTTGSTSIRNLLAAGSNVSIAGNTLSTTNTSFNLLNTNVTSLNAFGAATSLSIGAPTGTTLINNDLTIAGAALRTNATVFSLLNATATTINAFGAATTISIGSATGTTTVNNNLTVSGNLTVNGTLTTVNSTELSVDDKNITLGATASPTDALADGGGITLLGTTSKSFNWRIQSTSWTSSENLDLATGKTYKIDEIDVLSKTSILTNEASVNAFTSATSINIGSSTGTTDIKNNLNVTGGTISTSASTVGLLNTNAVTVTAFAAADTVTVGKVGGIFEILSTVQFSGDISVGGDVTIGGGDMISTTSSFNLLNTTVTDIFFGGAATNIQIGAATGITNVNNSLDVDGDLNIDGGDLTVSTSTFNLANTTATTVNAFGAATSLSLGSGTGTTTVNNNLTVSGNLTVNGTTTTVNSTVMTVDDINLVLGDTASPTNLTADTGGLTLKGTTDKTFRWLNSSASWTSSENLDLATGKTYKINQTDVLTGSSVLNSPTTVTAFQSATSLSLGATSGTTSVNNNLSLVTGVLTSLAATASVFEQSSTVAIGNGLINLNGNVNVNGTSYFKLPVGTTAQRSGETGNPAATAGHLRFNSSTSEFEGYDGTAWGPLGGSASFKFLSLSSTTPQLLDSFDLSLYRTAKYTVQMQDIVSTQLVEFFVIHNEYQATYDIIKNTVLGGNCASISVQISGGDVEVFLTPVFDAVEIQYSAVYINSTSPVVGTLTYIPTTDLETSSYAIDLNAYQASTIDLNA
jgi:hypothetical protein